MSQSCFGTRNEAGVGHLQDRYVMMHMTMKLMSKWMYVKKWTVPYIKSYSWKILSPSHFPHGPLVFQTGETEYELPVSRFCLLPLLMVVINRACAHHLQFLLGKCVKIPVGDFTWLLGGWSWCRSRYLAAPSLIWWLTCCYSYPRESSKE